MDSIKYQTPSGQMVDAQATRVGNGLLVAFTNQQIDDRDRAAAGIQRQATEEVKRSRLASFVMERFERARDAHTDAHRRILSARMQRNGMYSDEKLAAIEESGQAPIFAMITDVKASAAEAWISDIHSPLDDKTWYLEPTPIPELPPGVRDRVVQETIQAFMKDQMEGRLPIDIQTLDSEQVEQIQAIIQQYAGLLREHYLEAIRKEAKTRAKAMEDVIHDQLTECEWMDVLDACITDLVTDGTMIAKGPVLRKRRRMSYVGPDGGLRVVEVPVPETERIDPLDFFPAPESVDIDDSWTVERFRVTGEALEAMKESKYGVKTEIDEALRRFGVTGHDTQQDLDAQRAAVAEKPQSLDRRDTIEGYEHWGTVQGQLLAELEFKVKDELAYYDMQIKVVNGCTVWIKANPDPLGGKPYSKCVYEKINGSFWGRGVPDLMKDIQDLCNGAVRALNLNMGIAAGPQIIYPDVNRLADGEDITNLYPLKIHQFKNPDGSKEGPIQFVNIESRAQELLAIFQAFLRMADERTRIPAYAYGSDMTAGAAKTSSGLSMLMSAAARGIKKVIRRVDRFTRNNIRGYWLLNMRYHPDPQIKGDVIIVVKGALAIFVKEQKQAFLVNLLEATNNPVDMKIMGPERRANMLREVAKSHDLDVDRIVPTERELKAQLAEEAAIQRAVLEMQAQAAQRQPQAQAGQPQAPGGAG